MSVLKSFSANIHQITFDISVTAAQVLNKIDLPGAEPSRVIQEIEEVSSPEAVFNCLLMLIFINYVCF